MKRGSDYYMLTCDATDHTHTHVVVVLYKKVRVDRLVVLNPRLAADLVVDLGEGFLAVQLLAHLVVEAMVKHLVELFPRQERVGVQHLEAAAGSDLSSPLYYTNDCNQL